MEPSMNKSSTRNNQNRRTPVSSPHARTLQQRVARWATTRTRVLVLAACCGPVAPIHAATYYNVAELTKISYDASTASITGTVKVSRISSSRYEGEVYCFNVKAMDASTNESNTDNPACPHLATTILNAGGSLFTGSLDSWNAFIEGYAGQHTWKLERPLERGVEYCVMLTSERRYDRQYGGWTADRFHTVH